MMDAVNSVLQAQDAQRQAQIQTTVLKKGQDNYKAVAESLISLIQDVGQVGVNKTPGVGQNFDAIG